MSGIQAVRGLDRQTEDFIYFQTIPGDELFELRALETFRRDEKPAFILVDVME